MRTPLRAFAAALGAGAALGLLAAAGCSTQDCRAMKANGSPWAALLCGAEGTPAPEPAVPALSACQPREVMPTFFSLVDGGDPALAGLREVIADLGRPVCLVPADRTCASDDRCAIGRCESGLCPCQASHSPLTDMLGVALRAMAAIARDPVEAPGLAAPGCLSASQAKDLSMEKRSRICELRRMLDVLLQSDGGPGLIDDANVHKVLVSLLDYLQGKTDGRTHYDLFAPVGRMAGLSTAACDPAAPWALLDNLLGYLTPQAAAAQLGALQALLADPYTRQFLGTLSQGGGAQGRDSVILLVHALSPAITGAADGAAALSALDHLLGQLVYGSDSVPQSFKDEVRAVMDDTRGMLADSTGIFPALRSVLACAGSAEVRCANLSSCTNHDDELIGAIYDLLSRPEPEGGVDLATLVGALRTLATLDQTGQAGRTLRLVVQGIEGSPDPNDPHEARDAIAALAAGALTPEEGEKLVSALSALIEKRVLGEFVDLLHDLLYTCSTPPAR